jgi:hypothetical protein
VSAVFADGDGRRVVVGGVQGPAVRVVDEDDAVGAQLVDEGCRTVRAGHPQETAVPAARFPGREFPFYADCPNS